MSQTTKPLFSIVVVIVSDTTRSRYDTRLLEGTLEALAKQVDAPPLEIIVPYLEPLAGVDALRQRYPNVRFEPVRDLASYDPHKPGREHHDELRARGLALATGELVGLLEDHGRPEPGWAASMVVAHREPYAGIGGAIENAIDRPLNWGVYFCDFARYQNPLPAGESDYASDANTSYKREALESVRQVWRGSFQETAVNWALRSQGRKLGITPAATVNQHREALRLGDALQERFIWGRSYAASRSSLISPVKRLAYAALTPLLPAVLTLRIARTVASKGRTTDALVKALPTLVLLTAAWACGEFAGYAKGSGAAIPAPRVRTAGGGMAS